MEHDQTEQNISQDPDTGKSLSSEASAPPRSASGDVLSLIEDVERHLTRIRDVQSRQETEFEDLAERQRRVDDAENAFEARRCEVEEAAAALDAARSSLSEEQVEIDGLRTTLEERETRCLESAKEIENSKRDIETARAEVATDRSALDALATEIADREQTITEERGALDALRDEIEVRENAFVDRSTAAEAAIARLDELEEAYRQLTESFEAQGASHQQAMNTAEETIERHRSALESVGGDLESAQAELAASRGELESLRMIGATAEADQVKLLETVSQLESRCTELDAANASAEASLGEATSRTVEIESELAMARGNVETLEATIAEDQRQLQLAGEKLTELAQAISEQAPRLERGTAAIALLAQQQETIERLESRLTDDGADATNAVAKIRDTFEAKIAELDSALERARAEGADPEALEAAIAEARAPLEARIHELESGGGFEPSALENAIEEATAPLLAEIARLQADAESSDGPSVPRERHETVKERCRRAERRSDELETALSMTNDKGQAQEMAKRLRAKAERVGDAARHLELRKSRLLAVRKAIRSKGGERGSNPSFQELQRLESQRKELSQVRDFLSKSEQQMIRRWARSRSMTTAGWVMILAVLCSVGSWFGVQELVPISGAASVELRATPRDGKTLSTSKSESWTEWHEALATDPAFVQVVSKRLAARGIEPSGGEPAVASMLIDDLSFESDGPGRLRLVLTGADRRLLAPTLDAVAMTMASESARQAPRRDDGARASLNGQQKGSQEGGYASLIGGAVSAEVLTFTAMIAGAALAGSLLLVGLLYLVLTRAKRVFEEAEADGGTEFAM